MTRDETLKRIAALNKQFGEGTVRPLDDVPVKDAMAIPTGSLALDMALKVGGYPRGRITEIFGPEGVGKSTMAAAAIAQAQRQGLLALYIDMEHAVDPCYLEACGVDKHALLFSQPDTGEAAFKILGTMLADAAIIVVDSVPSLVTQRELDSEPGDTHVGVLARFLSQELKALVPAIGQSQCAVVFINQIRYKIGVMYGNPETQPGGMAMKFFAAVRLDVRRKDVLKNGNQPIGHTVRATVRKSKVGPPGVVAIFEIISGTGINEVADVLNVAAQLGIVESASGYYKYNGTLIGHGKNDAQAKLATQPELLAELRRLALQHTGSQTAETEDEEDGAVEQ